MPVNLHFSITQIGFKIFWVLSWVIWGVGCWKPWQQIVPALLCFTLLKKCGLNFVVTKNCLKRREWADAEPLSSALSFLCFFFSPSSSPSYPTQQCVSSVARQARRTPWRMRKRSLTLCSWSVPSVTRSFTLTVSRWRPECQSAVE